MAGNGLRDVVIKYSGEQDLSETYESIFKDLALKFFENRCYVSRHKFKTRCGFSIHHYRYIDSDLKYNQFQKTVKGKLAYMQHLREQIEKDPERFVLLEKMWHTFIDATPNRSSRINGLSRIKQEEWERLKEVVDKTERKIKKKKHYKRYKK